MNKIPCKLMIGLAIAFWSGLGVEVVSAESTSVGYAIVVSKATLQDAAWKPVVEALQKKYAKQGASVFTYEKSADEALKPLSACMPKYACFVVKPTELGRPVVVSIHRMMRRLDADPYTDAIWGIITGYTADDALRIAKRKKPLLIQRGASGVGAGHLNLFPEGFASYEGAKHSFWRRSNGKTVKSEIKPDPTEELVKGFNTQRPQIFFTSGHATERDWQIIYNDHRGGQFRCENGQLYGLNSQRKRFDLKSPEPKIYLPMGNCLIGNIPRQNCMATAWMHSGGVYQMFGYTAVTWYGYMGWGIGTYFTGQPGRFTFAEAFFLNNQALVHQLVTRFPQSANIEFDRYDSRSIGRMAAKYRLRNKDEVGLLWDRDVVAFYGDPAWEARIPHKQQNLPWTQSVEVKDGKYTVTVTARKKGKWPNRPLGLFLPHRVKNVKITKGTEYKLSVSDNFMLLPLKGTFEAEKEIKVVFFAEKLVKKGL